MPAPSGKDISSSRRSVAAPSFSDLEIEAAAKQDALERMEELRAALLRALEILHAVHALFELKPEAGRAEFARFVRRALDRLPELHAIEWIPRVRGAGRAAVEAAARAEGLADFCFCDRDGRGGLTPAPEREEYWPVAYVEPVGPNQSVLGFDLRSEPSRREALVRAAETGLPVATSPLPLAQTGERRLGFLVVMAVRAPERVGEETTDEEPVAAVGWVLAVFRVESLVERVFAPLLARGLHVEIRDLEDETSQPFSSGDAHAPGAAAKWVYEREMPIAGRIWRFTFRPGPGFRAADPDWLRRAAEMLQRANESLEQRVAERTAELAARGGPIAAAPGGGARGAPAARGGGGGAGPGRRPALATHGGRNAPVGPGRARGA